MILLQSYCRMYIVQKTVRQLMAAVKIQKAWRGYKAREWLRKLKSSLVLFQAQCRGFKVRQMIAMGQFYKKPPVKSITEVKNDSTDQRFESDE